MLYTFDGVNKLIYLAPENDLDRSFDAQDLYSEWKRWLVSNPMVNMKYPQAMRSIGGDPISATKYIAPYIEVMNDWNIKPFDGNYILTVTGNLFGTGGRFPFVGADSGTVVVSMETTGNALALQTSSDETTDYIAPIWDGAVGIIDAYQDGDGIHIRWGTAVDNSGKPVRYSVYISNLESTIWDCKLGEFDGNMLVIYTEYDGVTSLQPGITYYIGVRAVDEAGNETDNTNYATINYTGTSVYDEIITKLSTITDMLNVLLDVEQGNWRIENNQMIFFKRDGTELMRFNLYDKNGNLTETAVFQRVRVL
jgi:hypothetical protein